MRMIHEIRGEKRRPQIIYTVQSEDARLSIVHATISRKTRADPAMGQYNRESHSENADRQVFLLKGVVWDKIDLEA